MFSVQELKSAIMVDLTPNVLVRLTLIGQLFHLINAKYVPVVEFASPGLVNNTTIVNGDRDPVRKVLLFKE